jgi:hypothetical protein
VLTRRMVLASAAAAAALWAAMPRQYYVEFWSVSKQRWCRYGRDWHYDTREDAMVAAERLARYYHCSHRVVSRGFELRRYGALEDWVQKEIPQR